MVINDIWMVDDAHHGASVDLNAGKLPGVYAWSDCARDLLNFVQNVLPTVTGDYALGWDDTKPGFKVIGIGHSLSGNAFVQAACVRPDLFTALFLAEPMVRRLISQLTPVPTSTGQPAKETRQPHRPRRDQAQRQLAVVAGRSKATLKRAVRALG